MSLPKISSKNSEKGWVQLQLATVKEAACLKGGKGKQLLDCFQAFCQNLGSRNLGTFVCTLLLPASVRIPQLSLPTKIPEFM